MKSGTDRNVEAQRIYGKSWESVLLYLGVTKEAIENAKEEAERLNLIVGQDSVTASNAYRKSIEDMDNTIKGLKIRIGSELMPVLTALNNDMAQNGPEAVSSLGNAFSGLYELTNAVRETFRKLFEDWVYGFNVLSLTGQAFAEAQQALLTGHVGDVKAIWNKFWTDQESELNTHNLTMKSIEDDYTDSTMAAMGLGPKKAGGSVIGSGTGNAGDGGKPKENVYAEERNRLAQEFAKAQGEASKEAKATAEWNKIQLDYQERLIKYAKELQAGRLDPGQAKDLAEQAAQVRDEAEKSLLQKEQAADEEADKKTFEARTERKKAHALALLDLDKAMIERRFALGEISALDELNQLRALEEKKYQTEKKSLEDRLALANLEPQERLKINTELQALEDKRAASQQADQFKRQDLSQQGNGKAGFASGMQSYISESTNWFNQWKQTALTVCNSVENAFSTSFKGILTGQMTLGQGIKSIWSGIANAVVSALAQMAAKYITAAIAQAIFRKASQETAAAHAVAAESAAAAEFFEAYAWIPFGGEALALASIGVMQGALAASLAVSGARNSVVANAQGSLVTHPTLALIGEGGENEVVAPETVFKDWAGNLANSIAIQQHQALDYRALGASYASQAHQSGGGAAGYVDLRGATIMGSSAESDRLIGNRIQQLMQGRDRRVG
jgi:hypothetical protein